MLRFLERSVLVVALVATAGISGTAQKLDKIKAKDGSLSCRNQNQYNDRLVGNCEIREQTLALRGSPIAIDGRQNGGVSVKGWDQNQVLVRARVQTGAPTEAEAEALSKEIRIETTGAKIFASGPETRQDHHCDVSN